MGVKPDAPVQHRHQTCPDGDCQRYACRIWREGYDAGQATGEAKGHSEGYSEGFAAGAASRGDG